MSLKHPFEKARENREQMKQQAQQQLKDFDPKTHQSPVNSSVIWYFIGGVAFLFIMRLLTLWMGG
ncbi:hypothetical protein [Leuconostoc citreum]|uniref:hypothetical protein n=1 Tax=Leuconostoc citreum TaxID=33964 RepID=UPI0032DE5752